MKKKYFLILLLFFLFIFTTYSYCATWTPYDEFEYNNNTYYCEISSESYATLIQLPEYISGDYDFFYFTSDSGNNVQFVPKNSGLKIYLEDGYLNPNDYGFKYWKWADIPQDTTGCIVYEINENSGNLDYTYPTGTIYNDFGNYNRFYQAGLSTRFLSTLPVYLDSTLQTLLVGNPSTTPTQTPEFLNADTTKYGNTLENGKFNYFYIDGNDLLNFSFSVTDTNLINSNTIVFNLDKDSNFCFDETLNRYAIPKSALTFQYLSGHTYIFNLDWFEGVTPKNLNYTITTDFSLPTIINGVQNDLFSIDFEVQNISGVLLDYSFDNQTVIGNMPNSTEYINPAENSINLIFNAFRDVFTSESDGATVRFYIPYSNNQYIDIPANLVSSHIPVVIVNLIQMVYWGFICTYIIKDIAKTADKAKSGDILDDKNGNIKTEML